MFFFSYQHLFQILCPICREPLPDDLDLNTMATVMQSGDNKPFIPSPEVVRIQRTMAELYERQKLKGGIIDLEVEKNKYLVPKV